MTVNEEINDQNRKYPATDSNEFDLLPCHAVKKIYLSEDVRQKH